MSNGVARLTVGIPTYARGQRILATLAKIVTCDPAPSEIIVHVDCSDGSLEQTLAKEFPSVRCLSTPSRVGPGGGRHRCLLAAAHPLFASFDDDSWPLDPDYFARVAEIFANNPGVALLAAVVVSRGQGIPARMDQSENVVDYTGCGYAIRTSVYRELPGHLDRKIPYGIEERDLSLQLHAAGRRLLRCADLRVFHDTVLAHHSGAEITAGTIENAALIPWLRYPFALWPRGFLQYANLLRDLARKKRFDGMISGIVRSPVEVWRYRGQRRPYAANIVRSFLRQRRIQSGSKNRSV